MLSFSAHYDSVRFKTGLNRLIASIRLKRIIRIGIATLLLHARDRTKQKQAFKSMTCPVLQVRLEQAAFYLNYYNYESTVWLATALNPSIALQK